MNSSRISSIGAVVGENETAEWARAQREHPIACYPRAMKRTCRISRQRRSEDYARILRHMLDHGREAVAMAKGRTRNDLDGDRQLNLALVRLLEIVGEAASRMTPEDRALYTDIPWPQIVGLRNRLIHGYDDVDLENF